MNRIFKNLDHITVMLKPSIGAHTVLQLVFVKRVDVNGGKNLKKISIRRKRLKKSSIEKDAFNKIYKKAAFYVPKGKKAAYKLILLKRGAKKNMKYETN